MSASYRSADAIAHGTTRVLWRWRSLVKVAIALWLFSVVGDRLLGPTATNAVIWLGIFAVLLHPATRRRVGGWWKVQRLRQRLERAFQRIGDEPFATRPAEVVGFSESVLGDALDVRLRPGTSVTELERSVEHLAAYFGVREVRVQRHAEDASRARLLLVRQSAFKGLAVQWPLEGLTSWRFDVPLPVGIDEEGAEAECMLVGHHLLVGGEPGAGKSNALSLVIAAAALDPRVRLHLLDGKLVELAAWSPCAASFVGPSLDDAIALTDELRMRMDERYSRLLDAGRRKVEPNDPDGLDLVVCDELALYLSNGDKKACTRFAEGFRDLVARGRAAGVILVAGTQKPSVDIVPSSIRDLFGYRWAMRCATREASDTILGSGWAGLGYSAADIDAGTRGAGLLLHEGGTPIRLRAYHLDDNGLAAVVGRAARIRHALPGGGGTR